MRKAILLFALFGCASDEESKFIDGFSPPSPKSDEMQIIMPPVTNILPGQDITLCSYIDERLAEELDIVDYQAFQSTLGAHHAILYSVSNQQAANSHECNEDDMVNARYLAAGGADTPKADLPAGVVFRMPANTQLMIQTHWINATDKPFDGQAAFNLKVTKPKAEHKTAQLFTTVTTSFVLPEGLGSTFTECVVKQNMNVFMLGGHMHYYGKHVKITHTPAASATSAVIYETPWEKEYEFNPPRNSYPTDAPFKLSVGDKLRVDCQYDNKSGGELPFPSEMCVGFTYAYPMDLQVNCVDGNWSN
jgi:hypothetical protein